MKILIFIQQIKDKFKYNAWNHFNNLGLIIFNSQIYKVIPFYFVLHRFR